MAILLDLPPELLELIFHFLGSIDDVHHFGRANRKTYDVVQRQTIYVKVMRSIIRKSPQHRYDLQLCKVLNLHKDIVERMQQNNSQLPTTQPNQLGYVFNNWESALALAITSTACENLCCSDCLPDETVYEVLARYQGLRMLEDLWLERQLNENDCLSADGTSDTDEMVHSYRVLVSRNELYMDGEILSRISKTPETSCYTAVNADQRARFHSAVTCVWLLNEIRWVLTNFAFPTRFDVQIRLLEKCKNYVSGQRRVALLDELDQYAAFKFMYHHLLPLYGTFLADRDISKLPFTFTSDFIKDPGHSSRLLQLFLCAGQTYLQPPDLIDLVVRCKVTRRPPYPLVTLPTTSEIWQRPSQAFAFPGNMNINICDERYKRLLVRASLTHLNIITRSSFHHTRDTTSPPINAPPNQQMYTLRDHANYHFLDHALVAFELHENPARELSNIREVFPRIWGDELWSIWWWANSEDKARAKMERWRQVPFIAKGVRRTF